MHEITKLKNNIRIINKTLPQSSSVAIAIFVGAGGRYEDLDKNYGVTHFLEHLLFKGTVSRPNPKQIPEEIDGIGGYINAYTTKDRTCFFVKLPRQHWTLGLDVLSDMILHPLFNEKEIDRERGVILEEMNVDRDDPASYVFDLIGDLLWPEDQLRTNIIGNEQIISSISKSRIVDYYKNHYGLNNIVISVAGNLEKWEIEEKIGELFSSAKRHTKVRISTTKGPISRDKINLLNRKTNQSHFVLCARGSSYDSVDEVPLRVLGGLLGMGMSSRLSLNVREKKGLAYSIYATTSSFTDSGSFEIYAGVNKAKMLQALRAVTSEIAKVREQTASEKELNKVKELIKGRIIMSQEDNSNIADRLGSQLMLLNKVLTVDEVIEKIDKIKPRDLTRVAKKYLAPAKLRLAVIGPYTEKDKQRFEEIITN